MKKKLQERNKKKITNEQNYIKKAINIAIKIHKRVLKKRQRICVHDELN